jgi:hypothetical protein
LTSASYQLSLVVSIAVMASPMRREASFNWPRSEYALAKYDNHNGIQIVDPVGRNTVSPEVVIWIASEALPVRANTQPWFSVPSGFQNTEPRAAGPMLPWTAAGPCGRWCPAIPVTGTIKIRGPVPLAFFLNFHGTILDNSSHMALSDTELQGKLAGADLLPVKHRVENRPLEYGGVAPAQYSLGNVPRLPDVEFFVQLLMGVGHDPAIAATAHQAVRHEMPARAGEGAPGSRATGATAAVSEGAGTGTGTEAGGRTDAAVGGGGARAGDGAPGSRATAAVSFSSEEAGTGTGTEAGGRTDAAVGSGGARAGEGALGSCATGTTAAASFGSEEAGTGTGTEAGGRTDAAVSGGGARAGEGAPGSRSTGTIAAVSFGSEEAGTGTGAEAGAGTDGSPLQERGVPR